MSEEQPAGHTTTEYGKISVFAFGKLLWTWEGVDPLDTGVVVKCELQDGTKSETLTIVSWPNIQPTASPSSTPTAGRGDIA